jgi:uncharacterized protein YndB with AHSA1/START domain
MAVKIEPSGQRWVAVETDLAATPEQAWHAIATGPGVSSWFVPTTFETGAAGVPARVVSNFGPGMEDVARVITWEPPQRFAAQSREPGAPPIVTEWSVEPRAGGKSAVRVMHSIEADSDAWDGQLVASEGGWPDFFRILSLTLTHFRNQPAASWQLIGVSTEPDASVWVSLTRRLGMDGARSGERRRTAAGTPALEGRVEWASDAEHQLLLRLDQPCPGLAHLFVLPIGDRWWSCSGCTCMATAPRQWPSACSRCGATG